MQYILRPRDGIEKDARKERLESIMPGSRPGIVYGISSKTPTLCVRGNKAEGTARVRALRK